jgi:hypothetical protein
MKFAFFIIFSVYGKEIRTAFAVFRMRMEKSACQALRLCRPSFNVDDEKDFRTQQPAAVRKIQALAIRGDGEQPVGALQTAKRSRTEREREMEDEL